MKKRLAWVGLEGLRVQAKHGVHEEERRNGNEFVVDLSVLYEISKASKTDNINHAVDYETLAKIVKKEMSEPAYLLETVASGIVKKVFKKFKSSKEVKIKLGKSNPPMTLEARSSFVQMHVSRRDL